MASQFYYIPGVGNVERTNAGDIQLAERIGGVGSDLSRDIGLTQEIRKNTRFAQAMANPGNFLTERGRELTNLRTALDAEFAELVIDGVKDGATNDEAVKLAKDIIEAKYRKGLKRIEIQYPVNVEKLVKGKFEGKI